MINFKEDYLNALSYKRESTTTKLKDWFEFYPDISNFAYQHLHYANYIGHANVSYPYSIKSKHFNSYLILYTVSGQGCLKYCKNLYILKPNTVLFINCNLSYQIEIYDSSTWSFEWIYLNGNITNEYYNLYKSVTPPIFKCKGITNVSTALTKLCSLFEKGNPDELLISMHLNNLLTMLLLEARSSNTTQKIPGYIIELKNLFDTKYNYSYNLQDLSKQFKISKYTLCRDFSKYVHTSPIEYLIQKRISAAKDYLWNTELSVNEVSQLVGIENATHFINLFKSRVGVTPLQYRNSK